MCVSMGPADFARTVLIVSEATHPETGRTVHVLTYRNRPTNFSPHPNAMVLHFPASRMSQANVVDTSGFPDYVDSIIHTIWPPPPTPEGSRSAPSTGEVEVFDHGIYTVVLASSAGLVADALPRVPEEKRPPINRELFDWYEEMWPEWPIALCCFANEDAAQADPLLWWYEPLDPSRFMAPAVDCHTGGTPDLGAAVEVDHLVVVGTKTARRGWKPVHYSRPKAIPPFARALLPDHVRGRRFERRMRNRDFVIRNGGRFKIKRGFMKIG